MPDAPIRVLVAFDFGLRRIGVASGDTLTRNPAPRTAIANGDRGPDWAAITTLVAELGPHLLVVGAPYNADGTASAMTTKARDFAAQLTQRFGLPVEQVDERYSSLEAGAALKSQRAGGQRRKRVRQEDVDSGAAAVILQRWFFGEKAASSTQT